MEKPNILISWLFGIIAAAVSLGIYIGTAFITGWAGLILRLIALILILGIFVGEIIQIHRKLNKHERGLIQIMETLERFEEENDQSNKEVEK